MGKEIVIIPLNKLKETPNDKCEKTVDSVPYLLFTHRIKRRMLFNKLQLAFYKYWLVKGRATKQKRNSRVPINQFVAQSLDCIPQRDYNPTHWRENNHSIHQSQISEILTPQHYLLKRTDIPRSGGNIFILETSEIQYIQL